MKLLKLHETPADISFLSRLLQKKEMIYPLVTSKAGHLFVQNNQIKGKNLCHLINTSL
jgi:hypothetical protein